jgi:MFS family permease
VRRLPEQFVNSPDHSQTYPHPARLILILSMAPTIGLGIGRFAYALVLPDMRDSLDWSYSAAGFMNTINAVGYLAGALLASPLIKRFGLAPSVIWGTIACVASLALCALTGNFIVLSFARLLAGFAAAFGFVGGGALAATIAQTRPARANFLLSLFYAGPGSGILASGLIAPYVLQAFGPGSWWIVWWALTALSLVMIMPLLLAPLIERWGWRTAYLVLALLPLMQWPLAYAFLPRDPIAGHRPSISLLFASLCAAKGEAVGVLLSPTGDDGPAGLKAVMNAGGYAIAPAGLLEEGSVTEGFKLHKGAAAQPLANDALVQGIIKLCSK